MGTYHPRPVRNPYSAEAVKVLTRLETQGAMTRGELFVAIKLHWSAVLLALAELQQRGLILETVTERFQVCSHTSKVRPAQQRATAGNLIRKNAT